MSSDPTSISMQLELIRDAFTWSSSNPEIILIELFIIGRKDGNETEMIPPAFIMTFVLS